MKVIQFEERKISGISVRTTNANEMSSDTAEIGALYQKFDKEVTVDYKSGSRVYGVYFDYESDASGEFSVLSGADQVETSNITLQEIILPKGKYLVFEGRGEMPNAVIDAWKVIWNYFSDENSKEKRAYTTDFEHYKEQNEVDVYIAIK